MNLKLQIGNEVFYTIPLLENHSHILQTGITSEHQILHKINGNKLEKRQANVF